MMTVERGRRVATPAELQAVIVAATAAAVTVDATVVDATVVDAVPSPVVAAQRPHAAAVAAKAVAVAAVFWANCLPRRSAVADAAVVKQPAALLLRAATPVAMPAPIHVDVSLRAVPRALVALATVAVSPLADVKHLAAPPPAAVVVRAAAARSTAVCSPSCLLTRSAATDVAADAVVLLSPPVALPAAATAAATMAARPIPAAVAPRLPVAARAAALRLL